MCPTASLFRRNPLPEFSKSLRGSEEDEEKKEEKAEAKSATDSKVEYKRALFGQLTKAQVGLMKVICSKNLFNKNISGGGAVQKLQN